MLLSNTRNSFHVPHTSTCVIHTKGEIKNGDTISVSSPIFASINFISKTITMSDKFDVIIKLINQESIKNDNELNATLVCDDNDIFNMYVKI